MIIGYACGFCALDILLQCIVSKHLLWDMSSNLEMIIGYASLRLSLATAEKSYYINLVDEYKHISQKATKHCEIVLIDILVLKLEVKLEVETKTSGCSIEKVYEKKAAINFWAKLQRMRMCDQSI